MRNLGVGVVTLLTALIGVGVAAVANVQPPAAGDGPLAAMLDPKEKHLSNVRQLTFGGQNAEAYWSFDGKKLIFQRYDGDS